MGVSESRPGTPRAAAEPQAKWDALHAYVDCIKTMNQFIPASQQLRPGVSREITIDQNLVTLAYYHDAARSNSQSGTPGRNEALRAMNAALTQIQCYNPTPR